MSKKKNASAAISLRIGVTSYLLILAVIMIIPFVWAVSTSLKTYQETITQPLGFPARPVWRNYLDIFAVLPFFRYFINSFFVTASTIVLVLASATTAAYAFARLHFPLKKIIFAIFLMTLMIPGQVRLIPSFILIQKLGLFDSLFALIFPAAFSVYGIFLLRQFFLSLPKEYDESASIDGAGYFARFFYISVPMILPALTSLGIISLIGSWNDYMGPLVYIASESLRTLTLGLALLRGDADIQWQQVMAATIFSMLPIILAFLFAQRFFIEGLTSSGIKG